MTCCACSILCVSAAVQKTSFNFTPKGADDKIRKEVIILDKEAAVTQMSCLWTVHYHPRDLERCLLKFFKEEKEQMFTEPEIQGLLKSMETLLLISEGSGLSCKAFLVIKWEQDLS